MFALALSVHVRCLVVYHKLIIILFKVRHIYSIKALSLLLESLLRYILKQTEAVVRLD